MGIVLYKEDIDLKVSSKRLWQAMVQDSHNFFPQCTHNKVGSVSLEGVHGQHAIIPGTIRIINFHDGTHKFVHMKEIYEEVDDSKLKVTSRLIEGGLIGHNFSHCKYSLQFEEAPHGCVLHYSMEYEALPIHDGEHHECMEIVNGFVKAIEAYLLTHNDYEC